jgi:hypothetical protein
LRRAYKIDLQEFIDFAGIKTPGDAASDNGRRQYALRSLDTAHSAARGGIANLAVQRWMGLLLQRRPGPAMVVLVVLALIGII